MLSDALSFPRQSEDWLPTLLVGGILVLLSPLILPALVVQGYLVRVLGQAAENGQTPPSFTDWGGLLVDGLKLLVVNLVYGVVITVPAVLLLGSLLIAIPSAPVPVEPGSTPPAPSGGSGLGLLVVFALLAVLLLAYLLPAAFANLAIEGRLGAGFHLRTIAAGAFTTEYASAWLLALFVGFLGSLVGSLLTFVVVGVFVLFYVQVVLYYLVGRGFAEGLATKRYVAP